MGTRARKPTQLAHIGGIATPLCARATAANPRRSAGSAPSATIGPYALQAGGHWFEPSTAHCVEPASRAAYGVSTLPHDAPNPARWEQLRRGLLMPGSAVSTGTLRPRRVVIRAGAPRFGPALTHRPPGTSR